MDQKLLELAITKFQSELFLAIKTRSYRGTKYPDGQKAKEALIRSQSLIQNVHEAVKVSMLKTLQRQSSFNWEVFPPLNATKPELKIFGLIKGKDQDVVFLRDRPEKFVFNDGPNQGQVDQVGPLATERAIIIGVRSQMSSVDKNFDTLMERAFAETLNLRLRSKSLIMGEVYVIPVNELDDREMVSNKVVFAKSPVKIEKFVRAFEAFSGRYDIEIEQQYKYDSSALVPIDLSSTPPRVLFNEQDLAEYGYSSDICQRFKLICADGFDDRLIKCYKRTHE
jgi:hypothetical protein